VFAHVETESKFYVGKYGVNLESLDTVGVEALVDASRNADVIVIDEVGKMEVESDKFVKAVRMQWRWDKPIILTLHKKSRNPLLQDISRRDDVRILEVTPINRNLLPYKIIKLMKGEYVLMLSRSHEGQGRNDGASRPEVFCKSGREGRLARCSTTDRWSSTRCVRHAGREAVEEGQRILDGLAATGPGAEARKRMRRSSGLRDDDPGSAGSRAHEEKLSSQPRPAESAIAGSERAARWSSSTT